MSDQWSEGYFTDVGYTYGYYRELSPVYQRFCLLLRGIEPPQSEQPSYCELGFGQGISVNIHAAAVPGTYVGNDFNPEHAAYAAALASKVGSGARLSDDSFEQLLARTDLPAFDYISLHGIWSWVSLENQKLIVEFARRHLKPGGVLYVSYNCFPGWAAYTPVRQAFAFYDRFGDRSQPATERINAALNFTERLLAAKPRYLATAAGLENRLADIKNKNRNYLGHEYFNRDWNTMYFMEVADALANAKLNFAASCNPFDFVDAVNLTGEQAAFLGTVSNPLLREQMRDYMVNSQFRKDLFVRGARQLKPAEQMDLLLQQRFMLAVATSAVAYKIKLSVGEVELKESVYRPIVEFLSANQHAPRSLREIAQFAQTQQIAFDAALQAVVVLVGQGWVLPCQSEAAVRAAKPACDRFNAEIERQNLFAPDVAVLASPVVGAGVTVPRFSQLFLLAKQRKHADPVAFTWDVLKANKEVVAKDGRALQTEEENLDFLREQYRSFSSDMLPVLKTLGIA